MLILPFFVLGARRRRLQPLDAGEAPPPDREHRLLAPARRLASSASTTSLDRRQAGLDRPRRARCRTWSPCSRRSLSLALVLLVIRAYWRGPDTDARLVTACGGCARGLHGLRQGALAAVPDVDLPVRAARRRAAAASTPPARSSPRSRSRSRTRTAATASATSTGRSGPCSRGTRSSSPRSSCSSGASVRERGRFDVAQYDCRDADLGRHRRSRVPRLPPLRLPARARAPGDLRRQPRDRVAREHRAPPRRGVHLRAPGRRRRDLDRRGRRLRLPPREPGEPDRLPAAAAPDAQGRLARHAQRARPREVEARAVRDQLDERGLRRPAGAPAAGDATGAT